MAQGHLLGTPLLLTTYERFGELCQQLCRLPEPVAVEFANAQILTSRRHEAGYRRWTDAYDLFLPDGMPLVWCLNLKGARLPERVYGPTFMRKCLQTIPGRFTHYLLGGSPECGARLRTAIQQWNPACQIVGAYHGMCQADGLLEGDGEKRVLEEIARLSPDFIWVGLGTPKQDLWIYHHKSRIQRGLILSVGFAFDVNAGLKRDAPLWMQRSGLNWAYRLLSEPRRLWKRNVRDSSLFLFYLLWDGIRGRAFRPPTK